MTLNVSSSSRGHIIIAKRESGSPIVEIIALGIRDSPVRMTFPREIEFERAALALLADGEYLPSTAFGVDGPNRRTRRFEVRSAAGLVSLAKDFSTKESKQQG